MNQSIASKVKDLFVTPGVSPRVVRSGVLRGITLNLDLASQTQVVLGLHERETYSWTARLASGARTAFDIGSAEGEYAIAYSRMSGIDRVLAFEPQPSLTAVIRKNMEMNRVAPSSVEIVEELVGVEEGMVSVGEYAGRVQHPVFLKVDVDGGEVGVLESARALVEAGETRWVVETHSKGLEDECLAFFDGIGFETRIIDNAWWRAFIPEFRPIEHNRWLAAWPGPASAASGRTGPAVGSPE